MRRRWLTATVVLTIAPIVALPLLAPRDSQQPAAGLGWLLFLGSSVHVASTGWFYSVRDVRVHMRHSWRRFVLTPVVVVIGGVVAAVMLSGSAMGAVLLALFSWQFVHFHKQNLGVVALAVRGYQVAAMSRRERRALTATAVAVVAGLVGRPALLQVANAPRVDMLFPLGSTAFIIAAVVGVVLLLRRPPADRPAPYVVVYLTSLFFFAPVWLFSSPYAAIAGLTIAHGLQYLLLVGLVATGGPRGRQTVVSVIVLVDVAVLAGVALNHMSHLHGGQTADRVLFGCYLGLTAAHFVADAGLWRLRDEFPRAFLTRRLPFLLAAAR